MRRFFVFLSLVLLFCIPADASATKYVALTFDDGPSGRYTEALLEGLAQRDVRATFFLCGYRLKTYPELAQRIRTDGHEIGLHGYTHDSMATMSPAEITQELESTLSLLPTSACINLMRPPGGSLSSAVCRASRDANLAIVHWSVDPMDWATDDASLILRRVLAETQDGDVILLHDMTDSSVAAALEIVDALQAQGYQFLTVSQLALLRLCHLQSGIRYDHFPVFMKEK